jgi:hypothetical protein
MDFDVGAVVFGFATTIFLGFVLGSKHLDDNRELEEKLADKELTIIELLEENTALRDHINRIRKSTRLPSHLMYSDDESEDVSDHKKTD